MKLLEVARSGQRLSVLWLDAHSRGIKGIASRRPARSVLGHPITGDVKSRNSAVAAAMAQMSPYPHRPSRPGPSETPKSGLSP